MTRLRATLLSVLTFAVLPGFAQAAPPLTASAGLAAQVVTNRSFDLVSEDDHLSMGRIAAGYTLEIGDRLLDLEVGYQSGTASATLHETRPATLVFRGLDLGAAYRIPLYRYLEPYARASLGWDFATLSVGPSGTLEQRVSHPSLTALLGLSVPLITVKHREVWHQWLVFDVGMGYSARPSFHFDALAPKKPTRPDPDAVARAPVDLGTLALSGIAYRFTLTLRI
jgi:hypothetical protein